MDIMEYIRPELAVVAVVCYLSELALKKTQRIKEKYLPFILGGMSVILCGIWVFANSPVSTAKEVAAAVFLSITQGLLMAGAGICADRAVSHVKNGKS